MKNKSTAIILAFLLGGLGAHKFYLGKFWQGIACIAFCWTFIPAFIAIIDVIRYACMNSADWAFYSTPRFK